MSPVGFIISKPKPLQTQTVNKSDFSPCWLNSVQRKAIRFSMMATPFFREIGNICHPKVIYGMTDARHIRKNRNVIRNINICPFQIYIYIHMYIEKSSSGSRLQSGFRAECCWSWWNQFYHVTFKCRNANSCDPVCFPVRSINYKSRSAMDFKRWQ